MDHNNEGFVPGMSFSYRRARLLVFYSTIKALGYPEYIRILYNAKGRKLAIQCCAAIDRDSFKVPVKTTKEYAFEITSLRFLSVIYKSCKWEENKTFNVKGIIVPEERLAEFRLDNAREISINQFVDPESYPGLCTIDNSISNEELEGQ